MPESPTLQPPKAVFSASIQGGTAPLTVVFTDASTGTITGRAWSFGDGATSQDKSPAHVFENAGDFLVSLTVFNAVGASTDTYRIDVALPAEPIEIDREETILDLVPSIRAGLRRPSEQKLRLTDIVDVINDLVRGYSRDLHVSELEHRTDEADAVISHLQGAEYLLQIPNVAEVELAQLKFLSSAAQATYPDVAWGEISIVPLDFYATRAATDYFVASTFGGLVQDSGVKIKMNLTPDAVKTGQFRVRYRVPILKLLTLSSKTALPSDFLPMLKVEARIKLLQFIRDDSKDFLNWRRANETLMIAQIADWRKRWDEFLNTNTEPDIVRKTSANDWRRRGGRRPKYTIERREY